MATEIIPAPNVVQFPHRPHVRSPALAPALAQISAARALLAPLDQPTALACFDAAQVRTLIWGAVSTLHGALLDLPGEARP
jgi:hypothetical protein